MLEYIVTRKVYKNRAYTADTHSYYTYNICMHASYEYIQQVPTDVLIFFQINRIY